jgi:CheY-like chemotaxis protein
MSVTFGQLPEYRSVDGRGRRSDGAIGCAPRRAGGRSHAGRERDRGVGQRVNTVLLVDAAAPFRRAVAAALREGGEYVVVGEADSTVDAIESARTLHPDVVVVDLDLLALAGSDLIGHLRADAGGTHIVVFSQPAQVRVDNPIETSVARLIGLLDQHAVEGLQTVVVDLPNEPESVARARRFVESTCHSWAAHDAIDPALLVVSELVTNAITHGGGICALRLRHNKDALRIEVVDRGDGSPEIAAASDTAEGGRGLRIVTLTARAWGVDDGAEGTKVVWAELSLSAP